MKTMGIRLKGERARLGLSQDEFAGIGGVKRGAQVNYESGERQPDAAYLAAVANAGVDVMYVLTGVRSTPSAMALDEDTQAMVDIYRRLPIDDRAAVRRIANSAAKPAAEPKKKAGGGE